MRFTSILVLLALICALSCVIVAADVQVAAEPKAPDFSPQIKALQEQVAKLATGQETLRTTLAATQKENEKLLAQIQKVQNTAPTPAAPVKDVQTQQQVSELSTQIAAVRTQLNTLSQKMASLTITAQLQDKVADVKTFYTQQVAPKVDQGVKLAAVYATKAQQAIVPFLGQTQGVLSKVYSEVYNLITKFKPIITKPVGDFVKSATFIAPEYKSRVVDGIFAAVVFFVGFTAFIICYSIFSFILRLLCCCGGSKKQKQIQAPKVSQQAPKQQQSTQPPQTTTTRTTAK